MQTATDKKIDFLNDLEGTNIDSSVYPELERLSRDRNPEIRNRVAQVLGGARGEYTDILLRLLNDRDELVRVNACDSLSGTDSREAINELEKHIADSSELVRVYVYSSLYDTASMNPALIRARCALCFCLHVKTKNQIGRELYWFVRCMHWVNPMRRIK